MTIKTNLVKSAGEVLILSKNIVRYDTLSSNVVLEKEVFIHPKI